MCPPDHLPLALRRGVSPAPFSGAEPLLATAGTLSGASVAADGPAGRDPVRHRRCAGSRAAAGEPLHRPGHLYWAAGRPDLPGAADHRPGPGAPGYGCRPKPTAPALG